MLLNYSYNAKSQNEWEIQVEITLDKKWNIFNTHFVDTKFQHNSV